MDISNVFTVGGVVLTLLFGGTGIYLTVRSRYPGEISFVREQVIALFDEIVKNLPDLAVLYKNAPVSANIVVVRGAFVNTGRKDIAPSMVESPLTIKLPEGSRWLSAIVTSCSHEVKAGLKITGDSRLSLNSGLLRRKEYIRFQALADIAPSKPDEDKTASVEERVGKSLSFEHRIQDTRSVRMVELRDRSRIKRRLKFSAAMTGVAVVLVMAAAIFALYRGLGNTIAYEFDVGNGRLAEVRIGEVRRDSVEVKALDGKFDQVMPLAQFVARCKSRPAIARDKSVPFYYTLTLAFELLLLLSIPLLATSEYLAQRKLVRLLGIDAAPAPGGKPAQ